MNTLTTVTDAERDARVDATADMAQLGVEARRASETLTDALYDGLALTIYADEDGVYIRHGQPVADYDECVGPFFDLHAALCHLAGGLE